MCVGMLTRALGPELATYIDGLIPHTRLHAPARARAHAHTRTHAHTHKHARTRAHTPTPQAETAHVCPTASQLLC